MVVIRRVDTVMTGVAGTPFYNSLYFTRVESTPPDSLRFQVSQMWQALLAFSDDALDFTVSGEIANVEDTTGAVVDFENGISGSGGGSGSGLPFPYATQGLIRLRTSTVVGGRRLQGKIFVPSIVSATPLGEPDADLRTYWDGIMGDFIADSSSFGPLRIFSRKNLTSAVVTQASTWDQWSVLRSRRD